MHARTTVMLVAASVFVIITFAGGSVGAATPKNQLLSLGDLPSGWSVTSSGGGGAVSSPCLSAFRGPKSVKAASASFTNHTTVLLEDLATDAHPVSLLKVLNRALRTCHGISIKETGKVLHLEIEQIYFPSVTKTSAAFSFTTSVTGIEIGFDLVTLRAGAYVGYMMYGGVGTPSSTTCLGFAEEAVEKAEGKHVTLPAT